MKMLCGSNFSATPVHAVTVAGALAERLGDTLHLVPVMPGSDDSKSGKAAARAIKEKLDGEVTRFRQSGLVVEATVLNGSDSAARLVERWLAGSVPEKVAESVSVPTLAIKHLDAVTAWLREGRNLKGFIGTDFSAQSEAAIQFVASFRAAGPCEVAVAYVDWPGEESERLGIATEVDMVDGLKAAEIICQTAERDGVDIIYLSSHARSCIVKLVAGSVAQAVRELTHRPVPPILSSQERSIAGNADQES